MSNEQEKRPEDKYLIVEGVDKVTELTLREIEEYEKQFHLIVQDAENEEDMGKLSANHFRHRFYYAGLSDAELAGAIKMLIRIIRMPPGDDLEKDILPVEFVKGVLGATVCETQFRKMDDATILESDILE